jgi:hypothetical protein
MIFIKKNKKALNEAGSRAFGFLNSRILKFQNRLANRLNNWINSFSPRGQQRIFWTFIVLSVCGISVRLILSISRPDYSKQGNPGRLPKIHLQPTDSLTSKK